MSTVSIPNQIQAGQPLDPRPVMANFDALASFINDDVLTLDGSKAMTGHLTLSGPGTADGHAVTKAQLDGFLPLAGGTLTGDLQVGGDLEVDGNSDLKINAPADFWQAGASGTVFHHWGMGSGTQGSNATSMTSNGYRNTGGKWTSMGVGGNAGAVQVSLAPTGTFEVRTAANYPTGSGSNPPLRFSVVDGLTTAHGDLQVDGTIRGEHGDLQVDSTIRGKKGAQTAPTYSFAGDTEGLGIYGSGSDQWLRVTTGGLWRMEVKESLVYVKPDLRVDGQTLAENGNVAKPAYSFVDDTKTGMWYTGPSDARLRFCVDGEEGLQIRKSSQAGLAPYVYMQGVYDNELAGGPYPAVHVTPAGQLHRVWGSRLSNMQEIETVNYSATNSVYDLKPIWFRPLAEQTVGGRSYYGLAAEDVAAVDPRLATYTVNEDGVDVPDNVNTNAVVALLVSAVKTQRDTIADLAARVEALEGQKGL